VEIRNLVWSATTCDFPGAGLYLGLAPFSEHVAVARRLTARQLRVFTGGRVRMRADGETWPLNYFAVRDPSTIKVIPLDKPPLANGFKHVKLAIQIEKGHNGDAAGSALPPEMEAASTDARQRPGTAAFVATIGLTIAREERFFQDAVAGYPDQDWGDVYRRMQELGCREVKE
jgi:hypothetical protein